VRVSESTKDVAFSPEPLFAAAIKGDAQKLDRNFSVESAIVSLRKPNRTHPALADWGDQRVWTHSETCPAALVRDGDCVFLEKCAVDHFALFFE
jgi:hypothetical protein